MEAAKKDDSHGGHHGGHHSGHHHSSGHHSHHSSGSGSHFSNQDRDQFTTSQARPTRQEELNSQNSHLGRFNQCGKKNTQGINGRVATNAFLDGDSEFGE